MESRRLLIIGGGIAGLCAAYTAARQLGERDEVVLVERDAVLGGKARSHHENEWMVEEGPNGFLDNDAPFRALIRDLDLEGECIPAAQSAKKRFVLYGGRLCEVGPNPFKMLSSGLLGWGALFRALGEPRAKAAPATGDESVDAFVRRRFGPQIAERLAAPMVLGIFAGDSRRLSMSAAFPQITDLESRHGSVLRGFRAMKKERRRAAGSTPANSAAPTSGGLHTFRAGMQTVSRRLETRLRALPNVRILLQTQVTALHKEDERYQAQLRSPSVASTVPLACDAVIFAVEAWAAADLMETVAPEAVVPLRDIDGPPVTVVGLGFDAETSRQIPHGFGALVSRGQGRRILGCLWESRLFPDRSPGDQVLVRAMLGGAVDPEASLLDEDAAIGLVQAEVKQLLGLEAPAVYTHVKRWSRAIPQYTLGHGDRVATIERALDARPGLFLAGNSFYGVAFTKSAASGVEAGRQAAGWLAARVLPAPAVSRG